MSHSRIMHKPKKVLIIRNDKIGDFTLALPSFALLKKYLPDTELTALVPDYTRPIAELSADIDQILIDPGVDGSKAEQKSLAQAIKSSKFDMALTLYSTTRIGFMLKKARIPVRVAPATKLAQIFHNHRITQRRSKSLKPEYEYNLDLARYLLELLAVDKPQTPAAPYLTLDQNKVQQDKSEFLTQHQLSRELRLIFIHPGSGGSASNLSVEQFADLARGLSRDETNHIVLSAGPAEVEIAQQLSQKLSGIQHSLYLSQAGLDRFIQHIGFCDCFISGSTGPLHIAAALNRPTVGFFPRRRSATALRWQTINTEDRRLAFSPDINAAREDMSTIDLKIAVEQTLQMLNSLNC